MRTTPSYPAKYREEVEAGRLAPKLSGQDHDAIGRKRPTDEVPGPEEDGGEGGADGESGGELRAPQRRRLRMEQVASGSQQHEEQAQRKNMARSALQPTRSETSVPGFWS